MRKVQEVVRGDVPIVWRPGFSRCYRDKTKTGVRFKFDKIGLNPPIKSDDPNVNNALYALKKNVCDALAEEGYEGFKVKVGFWDWGVDPYAHPIVIVNMPTSQL